MKPMTRTRPLLPPALARWTAASTLLLAFGACAHEDDAADETAVDPVSGHASASGNSTGAPQGHPDFAPTDYTYRLEVLCFCPQVGPVDVTVRDGDVARAVVADGANHGQSVPEFLQLSINDVIDLANDPSAAKVDVIWPDGQDYPSVVSVDRIAQAVDDEVTYTIKDVVVSGE